jgi:uncharacterized cupin superfamily protein
MVRDNFLRDDRWDDVSEETGMRTRAFWRPDPGWLQFGASVYELAPGAPGFKLHMHYGSEEMFFVVAGTPTLRTPAGEERLAPGDVVYCREGRDGLHTFTNESGEPARIIGVSAGRFPDVVAYPEHGYAWVATRDPEFPAPKDGDPGIIARFDLPEDL